MLADLPDDVLNIIQSHALSLLYREKIGSLLDELTLKKTTEMNAFGCIFLNFTNSIPELDNIEYIYAERIPPLEEE